MDFRGRQNKNNIRRRFLQCFQQRIERSYGQHMHFIDNINLILSLSGRVRYFIHNLTDIVHAVVGCRVDFDHVHGRPGGNRLTYGTFSAGTSVYGIFTIYRPCKNFGNRGFTGTTGARKQIGMSDTVCLNLVFQGRYNMLLPFDILEFRRAELSVKSCIRHNTLNRRSRCPATFLPLRCLHREIRFLTYLLPLREEPLQFHGSCSLP